MKDHAKVEACHAPLPKWPGLLCMLPVGHRGAHRVAQIIEWKESPSGECIAKDCHDKAEIKGWCVPHYEGISGEIHAARGDVQPKSDHGDLPRKTSHGDVPTHTEACRIRMGRGNFSCSCAVENDDEPLGYDPIVKGAQIERALIVEYIRSHREVGAMVDVVQVFDVIAQDIEEGRHVPALPDGSASPHIAVDPHAADLGMRPTRAAESWSSDISRQIPMGEAPTFQKELENLINRHSVENDSDTPDFILASFLVRMLEVFGATAKWRDEWYEPKPAVAEAAPAVPQQAEIDLAREAVEAFFPGYGSLPLGAALRLIFALNNQPTAEAASPAVVEKIVRALRIEAQAADIQRLAARLNGRGQWEAATRTMEKAIRIVEQFRPATRAVDSSSSDSLAEAAPPAPHQFKSGIDMLASVNAALHTVNASCRIDVRDGQAIAVPAPVCISTFMSASLAPASEGRPEPLRIRHPYDEAETEFLPETCDHVMPSYFCKACALVGIRALVKQFVLSASPAPPSETPLRDALMDVCATAHNLANVAEDESRQDTFPKYVRDVRRAVKNARAVAEAASPLPPAMCPHCHLPAVLPEICTPEVNAAIERGIAQAADLYQAGREAASPLPRPDLLAIAIEYHKTVEGEYGCNGATCPAVKRLVTLLERVASPLPRSQPDLDHLDNALGLQIQSARSVVGMAGMSEGDNRYYAGKADGIAQARKSLGYARDPNWKPGSPSPLPAPPVKQNKDVK